MNIKNTTSLFSERLLQLVDHLRWTQKKLAREMKIAEHTISRWIAKGVTPRNRNILKICRATGCNPRFLSGDATTMFLVNSLDPVKPKTGYDKHGGGGVRFHPEERKLLEQARYVLGSEKGYSKALSQNIKMFYRAVKTEEANRRKGDRRKQDVSYDGDDRRSGERRQKIAEGE